MVRRIRPLDVFRSNGEYDHTHSYLQGYPIDWMRMSAAQTRQSTKNADVIHLESRLNQERMVEIATELRPDHNIDMVLPLDEGAGVSGQKKIYQRPKLKTGWDYLVGGLLGTWFVAREDRLFRDRHGTQSSVFTEACQRHHCILIIPGKRCYDFSRDDDLNVFKKKMDEAAAYLRHVRYMNDMRLIKQSRGEWAGGGIVAPYVIDRVQQAQIKEYIKQQRMLGIRATDIEFTDEMSQASRPCIYEPWLERARDLFEKMRLFNYETPRLMRYIEEKTHIFPFPSAEDQLKFLFQVNMKKNSGGYTFRALHTLEGWLTNLSHLGWMIAGRDEESDEPVYLEDCFKGAIPRDQFEEIYIHIKGEDLDGNKIERVRNKTRFTRADPTGTTDALFHRCFQSEYTVVPHNNCTGDGIYLFQTKAYQPGTCSEQTYKKMTMYTLPISSFDQSIVQRLAQIAEYDTEIAKRIREYFATQQKRTATNEKLITEDIDGLQKQYKHLQWLKTDSSLGQTVQQIQEIVKEQQAVTRKIVEAQKELDTQITAQEPEKVVPRFYDILGNIPDLFWQQNIDHRRKMVRMLIESIQIEELSPHIYALCINWLTPVAARPDTALLYKATSPRQAWSEEEKEQLRTLYPTGERQTIIQAFPNRSWELLVFQASELGLERVHRRPVTDFHPRLTYNDWIAACQYYMIETPDDKRSILETLNACAEQTKKREVKMLWLLPADKMAIQAMLTDHTDPLDYILSQRQSRKPWLSCSEHPS